MIGVFDGTAIDAAEQFSSGLYSNLTNALERWFTLGLEDYEEVEDHASLLWLEMVADRIYKEYTKPAVNFNSAMHETFMDLGPFGNAVVFQGLSSNGDHLQFRSEAFSNSYFQEGGDHRVNAIYRMMCYTSRQLLELFAKLPERLKQKVDADKTGTRTFEILNVVRPRKDGQLNAIKTKKPIANIWVSVETRETIEEGGYNSLPYHVTRWTKIAGETYGRGPGHKAIVDIRVLNRLERTILQGLQKNIDPPMMVPHESLLAPLKTGAGSVNYYEPGYEMPEPLKFAGNIPLGIEFSDAKRQAIQRAFHVDWLRMEKVDVEMTATEVIDRRDEKLRLIAPMIARQHTELLGPIIGRSYELLQQLGEFPPPPPFLAGKKLKIIYTSPAALAQLSSKATSMMRYTQEILPLAQVTPEILDVVDFDKLAQELAKGRGVSAVLLRTVDEIAEIRGQRQQQQQMAQMAEIAEPATKAIKNIADAQATAPAGMLP